MNSLADGTQYKFSDHTKKPMFKASEDIKPDTVEELQAKILQLETELKKQKEAAEKGAKILKFMWGDKFESDSLH